jgi:glycolate oxidase iron-sulfur subunit
VRNPAETRVLASVGSTAPSAGPVDLPAAHPATDRDLAALADACVLCGLCLPVCPTYALDRTEGESPRGRIMLMKGLAEGRLQPEPGALAHLDHCLACRNCEQVCPAHVNYGALLTGSRARLRERRQIGGKQRALEWLFAGRARLRAGLAIARWLRPLLPRAARSLPRPPAASTFASTYLPSGANRGRVALFIGCLGRHFDADTARAAIALLTRLGWQVDVPIDQACCGAVHRHGGDDDTARQLGDVNRHAFAQADRVAIITLASGCHETFAQSLSDGRPVPVRDIFDFLRSDAEFAKLQFRAAAPGTSVALHLPCTQRTVVRNAAAIAPLLKRIPGLEIKLLPETGCCGAAGTHMMIEPERAAALRAPVVAAVAASGAATLCTSNVGCRLHLAAGLDSGASAVRTRHPIELLAEHLP